MISMARTLGAPERVPAGKQAISASKQSASWAKLSAEARGQMHHVRIALDEHQPVDFHRTVFADAAQVVASQIDEHDVLGALFGIGEEFGFELTIFFFVASARARSGQGAGRRRRVPAL